MPRGTYVRPCDVIISKQTTIERCTFCSSKFFAALGHHTDVEGLRQEDLAHHGIVEVIVGQRSLELGHGNEDLGRAQGSAAGYAGRSHAQPRPGPIAGPS